MSVSYEQFRFALGDPARRAAMGLPLTNNEAEALYSDPSASVRYFKTWSAQVRLSAASLPREAQQEVRDAAPAAGWYPHPDDDLQQRWWNGSAWGPTRTVTRLEAIRIQAAIEAEVERELDEEEEQQRQQRRSGGAGWLRIFPVLGVLVVGLIIWAGVAGAQRGTVSGSSSGSGSGAAAVAEPTLAERRDTAATTAGFQIYASGTLYFQAADPATTSCGYYTCLWYMVASPDGCPGGIYVRADILNDADTAVGWTNEISASVPPDKAVAVKLEDVEGVGSKFRISEMTCL